MKDSRGAVQLVRISNREVVFTPVNFRIVTRLTAIIFQEAVSCSFLCGSSKEASRFHYPSSGQVGFRQDHRRFHLAFRNSPVPPEKAVLLLGTNDESRAVRKSGSPLTHPPRFRSTPGLAPVSANETSFLNERKAPADPSIPTAGADVGVPNQSHTLDPLRAHHAFQGLAHLVSQNVTPGRSEKRPLRFRVRYLERCCWGHPIQESWSGCAGCRAIGAGGQMHAGGGYDWTGSASRGHACANLRSEIVPVLLTGGEGEPCANGVWYVPKRDPITGCN